VTGCKHGEVEELVGLSEAQVPVKRHEPAAASITLRTQAESDEDARSTRIVV
jgi:hypothetical protein